MLKYIGIFILACSLSAYGVVMSSSLKAKNNLRKEILVLLKNIERSIKYGNTSVINIINECDLPYLNKCGFCKTFSGIHSAQAVVNSTLGELSTKDRENLVTYFSNFGKSQFCEYELKNCRYYIDYFEKTQSDIEKDIAVKINLYKKLGLLTGILSAIILI